MQIGRVEGTTRVLGKAQGYLGLPIRDELLPFVAGLAPSMVSAWFPTPREIEALAAGAPIHVRILGTAHPPIIVEVGTASSLIEGA